MVWRAGWYSSAPGLNLPWFPPTFFFFLTPFFCSALCLYVQPWGISLAGLAEGPAATPEGNKFIFIGQGSGGEAGQY